MTPEECQKKIDRLLDIIAQQNATISGLGVQIGTLAGLLEACRQELLDCLRS